MPVNAAPNEPTNMKDFFAKSAESAELHKKSTVNIFAIADEVTRSSVDHMTARMSGYSTPLETPQVTNTLQYRWEGMIHPNEAQRAGGQADVRAYNVNDSLAGLAENFAAQYRDHQDPTLQAQNESSYALSFEATNEQLQSLMDTNSDVKRVIRGLNAEEQKQFMEAFNKANEVALSQR